MIVQSRGILCAISVAMLLSGCSHSIVCAGQCSAPYQLDVTFVAGTSIATAKAVLQKCGHDPEVISVGTPKVEDRTVRAFVWTRNLGRSTKTEPLLSCLASSPSVRSAGWPD